MSPPELAKRFQDAELRRSPIREIMEFADPARLVELGLDPDEVISFAGGWVAHAPPEELRAQYRAIADDPDLFHAAGAYSPTPGLPELREMLVRLDRRLYGTEGLGVENVIVGQSSTQLTFSLLSVLLDPGDVVAVFDPTYANYPVQLALFDQRIELVRLPVLDPDEWAFFGDRDAILEDFGRLLDQRVPKLLIVSSPDNPTGRMIPDRAFFELLEMAGRAGCYVAVDHAYRDQFFTERRPGHFAASPVAHPHLIKIHSNSKWCRGLGRRLGWIEASTEVVEALEIAQQGQVLCPDTVHQLALARYLETALESGSLERYLGETRTAYGAAARHLGRCVEEYLEMPYLPPEGGLYTVIDVGLDGERFAREVLERTGVLFVPGRGFGPSLASAVRVSFGPLVEELDRMEEGFARVRAHLASRDA